MAAANTPAGMGAGPAFEGKSGVGAWQTLPPVVQGPCWPWGSLSCCSVVSPDVELREGRRVGKTVAYSGEALSIASRGLGGDEGG